MGNRLQLDISRLPAVAVRPAAAPAAATPPKEATHKEAACTAERWAEGTLQELAAMAVAIRTFLSAPLILSTALLSADRRGPTYW